MLARGAGGGGDKWAGSSLRPPSLRTAGERRIRPDAVWVLPLTAPSPPGDLSGSPPLFPSLCNVYCSVAKKIPAKLGQGWIRLPLRSPQPRGAPCHGTHARAGAGARPPLLPPGDVTQLLALRLIPFLTF